MANDVYDAFLNLTSRVENLVGTTYYDIVDRFEIIWEEISGTTTISFDIKKRLAETGIRPSGSVSLSLGKDFSETVVPVKVFARLADNPTDTWGFRLDYDRLGYYGGDVDVSITFV